MLVEGAEKRTDFKTVDGVEWRGYIGIKDWGGTVASTYSNRV